MEIFWCEMYKLKGKEPEIMGRWWLKLEEVSTEKQVLYWHGLKGHSSINLWIHVLKHNFNFPSIIIIFTFRGTSGKLPKMRTPLWRTGVAESCRAGCFTAGKTGVLHQIDYGEVALSVYKILSL